MNRKFWFVILSLWFIISLCFGIEIENKKEWKIGVGINNTRFRSTKDCDPKNGYTIGIYRKGMEQAKSNIQWGISFQSRNSNLNEKFIRPEDREASIYLADMQTNIKNIEVNLIFTYKLFRIHNIEFHPLIGLGGGFLNKTNTNVDKINEIVNGEKYDYSFGDFYHPLGSVNSFSWINYFGVSIQKSKYDLDIYFSKYNNPFKMGSSNLVLNEKINSLNIIFGICI